MAPTSDGLGEQKGRVGGALPHGEWTDEVLLKENPMRFVLFPINHDAIWHMYKKVIAPVRTFPLRFCVYTFSRF